MKKMLVLFLCVFSIISLTSCGVIGTAGKLLFELNSDGTYSVYGDIDNMDMTEVEIPETYLGLPVTHIRENAFTYFGNLKSVTIPSSITVIENYAFSSCTSLTYISIPKSVKIIEERAFTHCTNLTTVYIEEGSELETIGAYAFNECKSLNSFTIPSTVTSIGDRAFASCENLTTLTILNSNMTINEFAFNGCWNVQEVYFSGTEEQWSRMVGYYSELQNATIHYSYSKQ